MSRIGASVVSCASTIPRALSRVAASATTASASTPPGPSVTPNSVTRSWASSASVATRSASRSSSTAPRIGTSTSETAPVGFDNRIAVASTSAATRSIVCSRSWVNTTRVSGSPPPANTAAMSSTAARARFSNCMLACSVGVCSGRT